MARFWGKLLLPRFNFFRFVLDRTIIHQDACTDLCYYLLPRLAHCLQPDFLSHNRGISVLLFSHHTIDTDSEVIQKYSLFPFPVWIYFTHDCRFYFFLVSDSIFTANKSKTTTIKMNKVAKNVLCCKYNPFMDKVDKLDACIFPSHFAMFHKEHFCSTKNYNFLANIK